MGQGEKGLEGAKLGLSQPRNYPRRVRLGCYQERTLGFGVVVSKPWGGGRWKGEPRGLGRGEGVCWWRWGTSCTDEQSGRCAEMGGRCRDGREWVGGPWTPALQGRLLRPTGQAAGTGTGAGTGGAGGGSGSLSSYSAGSWGRQQCPQPQAARAEPGEGPRVPHRSPEVRMHRGPARRIRCGSGTRVEKVWGALAWALES